MYHHATIRALVDEVRRLRDALEHSYATMDRQRKRIEACARERALDEERERARELQDRYYREDVHERAIRDLEKAHRAGDDTEARRAMERLRRGW